MSVRCFYRACLVVIAVALLPACMGEGQTDAESAMYEADGLFDTTDGGRTLVFTYPDGSQLLLSATYYSSRGNLIEDCFPIDDRSPCLKSMSIPGMFEPISLSSRASEGRLGTDWTPRLSSGSVPKQTKSPVLAGLFYGADARTRTGDPFITSEVLYQLSYVGRSKSV